MAHLKKVQERDGSWPYGAGPSDATGGLTALALYALSASGVPRTDPAIARGLAWVERHPEPFDERSSYGTYAASLLVLALTRIDPDAHRAPIARLAHRLVCAQADNGMWSYRLQKLAGGDNSNSQFAILALWAAQSQTRCRVPNETWERVQRHCLRTQFGNGAWGYARSGPATASMTAAGLVAFVYARSALEQNEVAAVRRTQTAKRGLRWLLDRPHDFANLYYAYALERAGTVMAIPLKEWYVPGARHVVKNQKADGSWEYASVDRRRAYGTSLALLFLSRTTLRPGAAAVTKRETFPDLSDPAQLERGFDFYVATKPERRSKIVPEFGKGGPAAVGLFVRKLRHKREVDRVAAFELLTRLLDKRFFFDPKAPPDERDVMMVPIEAFWKRSGASLRWNARDKRFVATRLTR